MPTDSEVLIEIRNLEIRNLGKSFGDHEVLKDISLDVHKGEVISIIGPSGCGKSTFLRSINLLEVPTSGTIVFEGVEISGLVTSERINQMRKEIPTLPKEERPAARTELREQKRELRASRKEARAAKREARMESGGTDSDQTATGPEKVDPNLIRQKIGMVFQSFNLFPHKTVKENIMMAPMKLDIMTEEEASAKADELLAK